MLKSTKTLYDSSQTMQVLQQDSYKFLMEDQKRRRNVFD
jgi:hypothetical protein